MNWSLEIAFHFPHDRFMLGWEIMPPDDIDDFWTFKLCLLIVTFKLDI